MDYRVYGISWSTSTIPPSNKVLRFTCGHCGADAGVIAMLGGTEYVRSNVQGTGRVASILFCPACSQPSYFDTLGKQVPAVRLGADLPNVPEDGLRQLYNEARDCSGARAYTACVMACRKILMNLSVREGAAEGLSFVDYVDYLEKNGYTPKKGKDWVDRIRKMGNEANHAIAAKGQSDAKDALFLVEMLLRYNFELGT